MAHLPKTFVPLLFWLAVAPVAFQTGSPVRIPVCPGLTIVTAVSQPTGDYESIKRIESVTAEGARIRYSSYMPDPKEDYDVTTGPAPPWMPFTVYRTVRHVDLDRSASYLQIFDPVGKVPETVRGTTALGISRQSFRELRDKGKTALTIYQGGGPPGMNIDADGRPLFSLIEYRLPGELTRIDPTPVLVRTLVDDRVTDLPALRARGTFLGDNGEFFFLNDEANPISLKFRLGIKPPPDPAMLKQLDPKLLSDPAVKAQFDKAFRDRDVLQVVKISTRCEGASLPSGRAGTGPAMPGGAGAGGAPGGGGAGGTGGGGGSGGGSGTGSGTGGGAGAANSIEESLTKTGRAEVYSIYFAFNSDEIRPESEATLKEIDDVMRRHPDWKLAIEGHTDSIASDTYNLQLSQRRAAAVKNALVSGKSIAPGRLSTAGFGESRPKDTNDTLEGRARNRRVELVRLP